MIEENKVEESEVEEVSKEGDNERVKYYDRLKEFEKGRVKPFMMTLYI